MIPNNKLFCKKGDRMDQSVQKMIFWGVAAGVIAAIYQLSSIFSHKSAKSGKASSQYSLGLNYRDGKEEKKDVVKAYAWLDLAATQGHKGAIKARDKLLKKMKPEQVEAGIQLSTELSEEINSNTVAS